ncbi:C-terminal helicase domain-containing protein [Georgenia muralis]|uniref:Helicase-like protein n=1 Tax=Georgenia muralis TaxID=154117 RepID=A0A3N4ZAR6_9MICO|nr:helicase-related protein [Georgenia muralis]RPF29026.1 helicase-like protein [Georgenia muralis]
MHTITPPLRFQVEGGRRSGMPVLGLLYPSVTLARLGDPLEVARSTASTLPADVSRVRAEVDRRVRAALSALPDPEGTRDERWYWAAPFALDRLHDGDEQLEFQRMMRRWGDEDVEDATTRLVEHVAEAASFDVADLGARPDDLADVLTDLALAGPGVAALRALSRVSGGGDVLADVHVRESASIVSWGLRSLFNRPEIISILRSETDGRLPYWRRVLRHCVEGNLQSVLDEYAHVLTESEGLQDTAGAERAAEISAVMADAASIRTVRNAMDDVVIDEAGIRLEQRHLRAHFAMRFGRAATEDDATQREGKVRVAFNSPFWPFVLASTSVGQEGLDFHTYCHAVMHWNLPGNPVDLEQREGRVHRYKGHAVRRNVAERHHGAAFHAIVDDPWFAMFLAAAERRPAGESEVYPYWIFTEGTAKIERHIALAPLSTESSRYRQLQKSVGLYRVAIGQARQEDLVTLAGEGQDLSWMQLDLTP